MNLFGILLILVCAVLVLGREVPSSHKISGPNRSPSKPHQIKLIKLEPSPGVHLKKLPK
jgi:hypothetical protein